MMMDQLTTRDTSLSTNAAEDPTAISSDSATTKVDDLSTNKADRFTVLICTREAAERGTTRSPTTDSTSCSASQVR